MKFTPTPLADLLAFSDSGTWGDEGQPGTSDPVLRSTNIQESSLALNDIAWRIVPTKDRERRALTTGDILVTKSSGSPDHIGKCCLFVQPEDERTYYFSNFTLRLRANDSKADPRWIFYWLSSTMGREVLAKFNNTTTGLRNLDLNRYLAQHIATPPLPEQRRIADILDKADAIRRKRKEAIALTEELLRSAFLEMFGDPVTNPKGWEVRTLSSLLAMPLRNGLSPASGGSHAARVLTLSAITRGGFDPSAVKDGAFGVEPWNDVRLDQRDFLICRGNGNLDMVGAGALPDRSDPDVVFPDTMIAARVDARLLLPTFLASIWKSHLVRRQVEAGARTTNGTFKINQTLVESISIPVPPSDLQRRFDAVARQISLMREPITGGLATSRAFFHSLVDRAFSGNLSTKNTT